MRGRFMNSDRQTDRQTNRQSDRKTEQQTVRQTMINRDRKCNIDRQRQIS